MKNQLRASVAAALAALLTLPLAPTDSHASAGGGLSGCVVDLDGGPAAGFSVLLIDRAGELAARTTADKDGRFAIVGVAAGDYRLGIAGPHGDLVPVLGSPVRVSGGATIQRDLRLVRSVGGTRLAPAAYGPRADSWWSRQTRNQKIFWTAAMVVGGAVVLWGASELLSDDEEKPASPYE